MIDTYRSFFSASTSASAAFIGLLFVAISFIDSEKVTDKVVAWRRIVANSAFAQLANVFFVSLAGLIPGIYGVTITGCFMAVLGLLISIRLLRPTMTPERTGRNAPSILGLITFGVYALELVTSAGLLHRPTNQVVLNLFITSIILLYAGSLARAWEITGIRNK